jgi:phospholipase/carboxylesterase
MNAGQPRTRSGADATAPRPRPAPFGLRSERRAVGGLVESPDYAFAFRELEPTPSPPRRLVIALHGADGDEMQFGAFGTTLAADDVLVLPRAPRTIAGGRLGWFRESVGDGDASAEPEEFDDSLAKLHAFVGQQQARHGLAPADTVLVGFSQGGALALSAAVTEPRRCAAVAAIGARLPRRVEERVAAPHELAHLHVLLLHAPDDEVLPPAHAEAAAAFLTAQQLQPTLHHVGGGHRFSPGFARELLRWLTALPRPH